MSSTPDPATPAGASAPSEQSEREAAAPSVEIPVPTGEVRLLSAVQRRLLRVPGSREAAVLL